MTMTCPNCGSPVMIRGNQWECGWCGNFGPLPYKEIRFTLTISPKVKILDPSASWQELINILKPLVSPQAHSQLIPLLGRAIIFEISKSVMDALTLPSQPKLNQLDRFLKNTPQADAGYASRDIISAFRASTLLFADIGDLSGWYCGQLWALLIESLPKRSFYDEAVQEKIDKFFDTYAQFYDYFDESDPLDFHSHSADLYREFCRYWEQYTVRHPDKEMAEKLLSQGQLEKGGDICRDILIALYPRRTKEFFDKSLPLLHWWDMIEKIMREKDPQTSYPEGIAMWRSLLDIAESSMKKDPMTAQELFYHFLWDDETDSDHAEYIQPFIDALEDEAFARQLFQSAWAGKLQRNLLRGCHSLKRFDLEDHLIQLLLSGPAPRDQWEKPLKRYVKRWQERKKG